MKAGIHAGPAYFFGSGGASVLLAGLTKPSREKLIKINKKKI